LYDFSLSVYMRQQWNDQCVARVGLQRGSALHDFSLGVYMRQQCND